VALVRPLEANDRQRCCESKTDHHQHGRNGQQQQECSRSSKEQQNSNQTDKLNETNKKERLEQKKNGGNGKGRRGNGKQWYVPYTTRKLLLPGQPATLKPSPPQERPL
jgi:hypothetical protein